MKQIIDLEQLNKLSDEQKERLQEWCIEKGYGDIQECSCGCGDKYLLENSTYLLSIGQMIELIRDKEAYDINHSDLIWEMDIVDNLWKAVKKVL